MLLDVGVGRCSGRPFFFFFIKENWISAMTRHYAKPNNVLLTRSFSFYSDVRQWTILQLYQCVVFGLHRTIECEFNVTCLVLFLFWFRSHAGCDCCSIVCLRLQLHTQEYKATKKQIVSFQLKKSKESHTRLMSKPFISNSLALEKIFLLPMPL